MRPYIGITDFTDFKQVEEMSRVFDSRRPPESNRILHVGVMMSHKTLHNIPSKWQKAFPSKETIASIFSSTKVYNCLHYVDYDNNPDLRVSIAAAISYGGDNLRALQLDMTWPDPDEISSGIQASRKSIEVILQIGRKALEKAGDDAQKVVERLNDYKNVIHRVLLDKSMGKGLGMDANGLMPFLQVIRDNFPKLGLGAAGGLGPTTVHLVEPLLSAFPDLSIDAQGRLRPSGSALDPIDWTMAKDYLVRSLKLLA